MIVRWREIYNLPLKQGPFRYEILCRIKFVLDTFFGSDLGFVFFPHPYTILSNKIYLFINDGSIFIDYNHLSYLFKIYNNSIGIYNSNNQPSNPLWYLLRIEHHIPVET